MPTSSDEYLKLLSRVEDVLAKGELKERITIPELRAFRIGMRTVIRNLGEIAKTLNRDPKHLALFFAKSLATSSAMREGALILKGVFQRSQLNGILQRYVESYVRCPVCKRLDTHIVKEEGFYFLLCDVCGAKSSVRKL
ncbi:MAG TPA: translation initiation factor IF-2 subunit beta [Candidatus Bathyarchaeota archaeon]|nr:translation initiation factor IF-2 subunit beta [Candidatus Bathyarchaeota archaeon]